MVESVLVAITVAILCATLMAPMQWVLNGAAILLAIGFALGAPTGIWYHVVLGRALRPRNQLPPRWWLQPTALHPMLLPDERDRVLRWFVAGGVGFVFTALGCVALAGAAMRLVFGEAV